MLSFCVQLTAVEEKGRTSDRTQQSQASGDLTASAVSSPVHDDHDYVCCRGGNSTKLVGTAVDKDGQHENPRANVRPEVGGRESKTSSRGELSTFWKVGRQSKPAFCYYFLYRVRQNKVAS